MAELIAFIKHIKDEPLALVVFGAMLIYKAFEALIKYVPQFFTKEKKKSVEEWQNFVSESIKKIETKIEKLFVIVSSNEVLLNKTSEGTLENQLFNDNLSIFIRLKAFRRLLAMKKNGRIWERGFKLILESKANKEMWLDVLDTELGVDIVDEEYYQARLDEIRKRIFDDFSGK